MDESIWEELEVLDRVYREVGPSEGTEGDTWE